jgi:hypothetical protein
VITGARLQRKESGLPYPLQSGFVKIVELHDLRRVTVRPDNDVVPALCRSGKEFGQWILELSDGLLGPESPLLSVDVEMRQVKMRCAHTGERIEHPEGFFLLTHASSPFVVGLPSAGRSRKELADDSDMI